jgi:hypothetical protein
MINADDPYADFETLDEVLAFILHEGGPETLKKLLAEADFSHAGDRQVLQRAADGLEAAGLLEGSAIVIEAVEQLQNRVCPEVLVIMADPNRHNVRAGLAQLFRRNLLTEIDAAHISEHLPDDLDYITGQTGLIPAV